MIPVQELQQLIEEGLPGSTVEVTDLTGTEDHYSVVVKSAMLLGNH